MYDDFYDPQIITKIADRCIFNHIYINVAYSLTLVCM